VQKIFILQAKFFSEAGTSLLSVIIAYSITIDTVRYLMFGNMQCKNLPLVERQDSTK